MLGLVLPPPLPGLLHPSGVRDDGREVPGLAAHLKHILALIVFMIKYLTFRV